MLKTINQELTYKNILDVKKCSCDIIEFAKYYYITDENGEHPIELKEYQKKLLSNWVNYNSSKPNVILNGARQIGKTTLMSIFILWYAIFNNNKVIGIMTNKQCQGIEILSKIKEAYTKLPLWLQPGLQANDSVYNWHEKGIELSNNTKIRVLSELPDIRSKTFDLLYMDEFAYFDNNKARKLIHSFFPTISTSNEKRLFIISTPNGINNLFYEIWNKADTDESTFNQYLVTALDVDGHDINWLNKRRMQFDNKIIDEEYLCKFIDEKTTNIESKIDIDKLKNELTNNYIEKIINDIKTTGKSLITNEWIVIDRLPYNKINKYIETTIIDLLAPYIKNAVMELISNGFVIQVKPNYDSKTQFENRIPIYCTLYVTI